MYKQANKQTNKSHALFFMYRERQNNPALFNLFISWKYSLWISTLKKKEKEKEKKKEWEKKGDERVGREGSGWVDLGEKKEQEIQ
jgi:hypothetical protein